MIEHNFGVIEVPLVEQVEWCLTSHSSIDSKLVQTLLRQNRLWKFGGRVGQRPRVDIKFLETEGEAEDSKV